MVTQRSDRLAEEQAALRRVATLIAGAAASEKVFVTVAEEVGRLLRVDYTVLSRYEPDRAATVVGTWTGAGRVVPTPVGSRIPLGRSIHTLVLSLGRPARIEDYSGSSGSAEAVDRGSGSRMMIGVPIRVEGEVWGALVVVSGQGSRMPPDTEARLEGFTELVATAISNVHARMELRAYAEEQAALRRVATLVAQGASSEEVFAVVAEEVRRMIAVDMTVICRYDPDMVLTYVGWSQNGDPGPVGVHVPLGGRNVAWLVYETGRPARIDDYGGASGPAADLVRPFGLRAAVGVPVRVEGRLWGVMTVASTTPRPPPLDTEARLAGFTELVGTAIANAQARVELRGFADEQAAMRRVATLVARGATPEKVFATVTAAVGGLLGGDVSMMSRYTVDGGAIVVGVWAATGATPVSVGRRLSLGGWDLHTLVFRTGRPARINDYSNAEGAAAEIARNAGVRAAVGVPIKVKDRVWGVIGVASGAALPMDVEARLMGFTELVGTALVNTEAQAALAASRARIVTATDTARRRIERDLHDGAQQRLVSALLQLRGPVRAAVPPTADELRTQLDEVDHELTGTLDELQELARGIHPSVLAGGGLRPALTTLTGRSSVPVELDLGVDRRLPEKVEIAAYYVVSEALTNVAKHARASDVHVKVHADKADLGHVLRVEVRDNGRGGARLSGGSGLVGLKDRVEALGGTIRIESPVGEGTALHVTLSIPTM